MTSLYPKQPSGAFSASGSQSGFALPARIGSYRVLRELGRGGMGAVYEVQDEASGGHYALKVLGGFDVDEEALLRFAREGELMARVRHPGVVRVHSAQLDRAPRYLVLDLCTGGTIQSRLDTEGPLDPEDARRIALGVARALEHLHGEEILHRDLKPANVLFDEHHAPRLADFGLARSLAATQALTATQDVLGTPAYMAPEQALDSRTVDERTDVYGLGGVLYAMLTGDPPISVKGRNLTQVLHAVYEEEPRPPQELRRENLAQFLARSGAAPLSTVEIPPDLTRILSRALAKDPDERYQSAADFADALEGGDGGVESLSDRALRWALVTSLGVALSLGVVLIAALVLRTPGESPNASASASPSPEPITSPSVAPSGSPDESAAEATWDGPWPWDLNEDRWVILGLYAKAGGTKFYAHALVRVRQGGNGTLGLRIRRVRIFYSSPHIGFDTNGSAVVDHLFPPKEAAYYMSIRGRRVDFVQARGAALVSASRERIVPLEPEAEKELQAVDTPHLEPMERVRLVEAWLSPKELGVQLARWRDALKLVARGGVPPHRARASARGLTWHRHAPRMPKHGAVYTLRLLDGALLIPRSGRTPLVSAEDLRRLGSLGLGELSAFNAIRTLREGSTSELLALPAEAAGDVLGVLKAPALEEEYDSPRPRSAQGDRYFHAYPHGPCLGYLKSTYPVLSLGRWKKWSKVVWGSGYAWVRSDCLARPRKSYGTLRIATRHGVPVYKGQISGVILGWLARGQVVPLRRADPPSGSQRWMIHYGLHRGYVPLRDADGRYSAKRR